MTEWRTAKDCNIGECVEIKEVSDGVAIRDSKDPDGPTLTFRSFEKFVNAVKAGDFDDLI